MIKNNNKTYKNWPIYSFSLFLILLTLTLWQALNNWQIEHIKDGVQHQSDNFKAGLEAQITSEINALKRMGARWESRKGIAKEEWLEDAGNYIDQIPIFQAIEWVDSSFHIRWIEPLKGNENALNLNLAFEKRRFNALERARDKGNISVTRTLSLVQGGRGFLIYTPLFIDEQFNGFILGVVRIDKLFSLFKQSSQFNENLDYQIFDGDELIYSSTNATKLNKEYQAELDINVQDTTWHARLTPTDYYLSESKSLLPYSVLISGLIVTLLLHYFYFLRRREQVKTELLQQEATRRISAEQEKKLLRKRNDALFNCAPVGMIMVGKQGKIITANQEALDLFGYNEEQLFGESVDILLPDDLRKQHAHRRHGYMAHPTPRKMATGAELQGRRYDGSLFTLDISLTPLEDEHEGRVLVSVIDITEITNNKKHLIKHTIALEKTNQELERSNNELNDFAYVASHDLKAPLRGIMQLANWIEEDLSDTMEADTAEHLRLMQNRVTRLEGLLDDLLSYSRVGRNHGDFKTVNLTQMTQEIFQLMAPPEGFTLTCEKNLPEIVTLSVPLEQLLRNLINNAIKHHDKDEGSIHISTQPADKGFEFVVSDDGPGIPPEQHERVFRIFQTLRPRDEVEGSGMGLAIIKKLLDNYQCHIRIESDGVRGTRMVFTWPYESTLRGFING